LGFQVKFTEMDAEQRANSLLLPWKLSGWGIPGYQNHDKCKPDGKEVKSDNKVEKGS
jgi:hypothetical protein